MLHTLIGLFSCGLIVFVQLEWQYTGNLQERVINGPHHIPTGYTVSEIRQSIWPSQAHVPQPTCITNPISIHVRLIPQPRSRMSTYHQLLILTALCFAWNILHSNDYRPIIVHKCVFSSSGLACWIQISSLLFEICPPNKKIININLNLFCICNTIYKINIIVIYIYKCIPYIYL